jgi:hypothetical protein
MTMKVLPRRIIEGGIRVWAVSCLRGTVCALKTLKRDVWYLLSVGFVERRRLI